jgi:hypothetical protein
MSISKLELPEAEDPGPDGDHSSQRKRPERGRFLLQIDRQTKASYDTAESAVSAGLAIKTRHPVVQVSVYDTVQTTNTLVTLPAT